MLMSLLYQIKSVIFWKQENTSSVCIYVKRMSFGCFNLLLCLQTSRCSYLNPKKLLFLVAHFLLFRYFFVCVCVIFMGCFYWCCCSIWFLEGDFFLFCFAYMLGFLFFFVFDFFYEVIIEMVICTKNKIKIIEMVIDLLGLISNPWSNAIIRSA